MQNSDGSRAMIRFIGQLAHALYAVKNSKVAIYLLHVIALNVQLE